MVSRPILIAIVVAVLGVAGIAAWFFAPAPQTQAETSKAPTQPPSGAERRAYREKFFGGDTERDIRGGQEMKPRW